MTLDAGRLRERIRIEQESSTPNGQGGFDATWTELRTVRAEVIGLSGVEALKAGIERSVQQWRVTIRRRGDVTPKNRLVWKGVVMNIKSAVPDPMALKEATLLLCESGG